MRYIIKKREKPEPPKIGDIRLKTRFLFFPKKLGNQIRWLEYTSWYQKYVYLAEGGGFDKGWVDMYWCKW